MARPLNVIVFPGGFNLPIWAGVHLGAFARQDLEIRLHFTTNSMQQLSGLVRGALQRCDALKEGKHAGTLLVTPFELIAQKLRLRVLQNASEVLPHYQGISGTARRSWARDNPQLLAAFIRGYLAALEWLYDRRNEDAACSLLVEKVPNMSAELAKATYRILVAEQGGFEPKA